MTWQDVVLILACVFAAIAALRPLLGR
jgi:hypothetical protein